MKHEAGAAPEVLPVPLEAAVDAFAPAAPRLPEVARQPVRVLLAGGSEADGARVGEFLSRADDEFEMKHINAAALTTEAFEAHSCDVVLLDLEMGAAGSMDLLHEALCRSSGTPVILLTEGESHEMDVQASAAGAADYLVKLYLNGPLLERSIRYALERKHTEQSLQQSQRLLQGTLDALGTQIAVLDEEGRVLTVNQAWRGGAVAISPCNMLCTPGFNFLECCRDSTGGLATPSLADAIEAVLQGDREEHCDDLSCNVEGKTEWFRMRISRFAGAGRTRVAVACECITESRGAEEKVRRSKERYRRILATAHEGIWMLDRDDRSSYVNPRMAQLLGWTQAEMAGQPFENFVMEDELPALRERRAGRSPQGSLQLDLSFKRRDGSAVKTIVSTTCLVDEEGRPDGEVAMVTDITERYEAEAQAGQLASIVNSSDDAIYSSDLDGTVCTWNSGAQRLYGYSPEEVIGRSALVFIPPDRQHELAEASETVRAGQSFSRCQTVRLCKGGRGVDVSVTISPIRDKDGRIAGMSAIGRDISEQKRVERALRESEARMVRLAANVPGMVFQLGRRPDGSLSFPYVSEGCRDLLGVEPHDITAGATVILDCIEPEDRTAFDAALRHSMESAEDWKWEGRIAMPTGETKWVQGAARPDRQDDGDLLWDGLLMDITQRRGAEELQRARTRADQANQSKSEFLSRMSHELRTPMNSILGFAQLLEMEDLTARQRERVEFILVAGRHLLELINEVLDIARIEAGKLHLSMEPVGVGEVFAEILSLMQPQADTAGISTHNSFTGPSELSMMADRQRIKQVLLNLVSNAIKYNRKSGSVTLACRSLDDNRLQIRVSDTGHGIAAERLGLLFSPFERLGAQQSSIEGTGLGLSLSKRLVEAMGGTIEVESGATGSTFVVQLQAAEDPACAYARHKQESPSAYFSPAASAVHTILYIEDNLANLKLIRDILGDRPDIELITLMQGSLAFDMALENRPDLILLDLGLPDVSGLQVLSKLQSDRATSDIPVIVISADATPGQVQRLLAQGAGHYLTKPLDVKQFLTVLDRVLDDAPDLAPAVYARGEELQ